MARWMTLIGGLGLLPLMIGCGDAHPPTAPVSGTVTYQGKPLPTGTVMFIPSAVEGAAPAYGEIQPDGTYTLTTWDDGDGAVVGSHRVAVTAVEVPDPNFPEAQPLIPFEYSSEQTSGLTAEVKDQETNVVDLDL